MSRWLSASGQPRWRQSHRAPIKRGQDPGNTQRPKGYVIFLLSLVISIPNNHSPGTVFQQADCTTTGAYPRSEHQIQYMWQHKMYMLQAAT